MVRCPKYERAPLNQAIARAIEYLPRSDSLLRPGRRVLLKPNLISACDPPERATNTHPEFVAAVGRALRARGCDLVIGDSCGSLARGSTARAIRTTRLDRVAEELGAEIVDIDRAPAMEVDIPGHRVLGRIMLPRFLREIDVIVTLPKFKTHGLTLFTGAVKNQLGLIPGRGKKDVHVAAPKPTVLADALLDVYSVVRPHLAFMDAIIGMEGNGPVAGTPRQVGLVIGADDGLALDTVAATIMGYARDEIDTTRLGRGRHLGPGRLDQIDIRGAALSQVLIRDYQRPPRRVGKLLMQIVPEPLLRWLIDEVSTMTVTVDPDVCVLCAECIRNCPVGALSAVDGLIVSDSEQCISCYCCTEVCDARALSMQRTAVGRMIRTLKAPFEKFM